MSQPSIATYRPAAETRYGQVTLHSRRRRLRLPLIVMLVLVLAAVTAVAVRQYRHDDIRRHYLGADAWPHAGQAAFQLGSQPPQASPAQRPAPIASLAKVMTAYLVLQQLPLEDGQSGPQLTVSGADVADTGLRRGRDESIVPVAAGEVLTERQALMAVLLPSANNIAVLLARYVAGSVAAFVARMNRMALALGMRQTRYTDPSGFDDGTRSTAADQLILARAAARHAVISEMVATRSYRIPVAGTIHNTDLLLGSDGFVGTKTGSDDAAGGCFMFHTRRVVNGQTTDLIGVVMGQHGDNLITAGLSAAKQLAAKIAPTAARD